jgi:hypothetical protein
MFLESAQFSTMRHFLPTKESWPNSYMPFPMVGSSVILNYNNSMWIETVYFVLRLLWKLFTCLAYIFWLCWMNVVISSQQQQQQQPEPNFQDITTQSWYPPSVVGSSSHASTPTSSSASPHQRASDHPQSSSRGQPSPAEAAGIIARLKDKRYEVGLLFFRYHLYHFTYNTIFAYLPCLICIMDYKLQPISLFCPWYNVHFIFKLRVFALVNYCYLEKCSFWSCKFWQRTTLQ